MNKRLPKQTMVLNQEDISKLGSDNCCIQMLNNDYDLKKRLDLLIVRYLGNYKLKGAMYLRDVIEILLKEDMSITQMYKLVGKKYDVEWNVVERNIRNFKEHFWNIKNEINDNIKLFLFGNLAYNKSITNSDFLYGIAQFLLTDFKLAEDTKENKKVVLENYSNTAHILSDFAKDTNNFPVSKEQKETLGCFYWILSKLAENLGDYVYEKNSEFECKKFFYYLKFVVTYIDNGKVVIIPKDDPSSTYCVSNKDVLLNVIHSIDDLENYRAYELIDTISEFTVWAEKE